ncbi:hypothetical protein B0T24DRAFT_306605 [Lasiosphaeria ovina]|uniref:Uncharacterized protein n=1 Tax=Lasiosphaeria ovina TaxID=92902 RepID=A0AAE0K6M8_9PEZI|nr:hypothetical protein B0T24DRAFT_306605 [Lasiosphaeria ovina]
MKFAIVLSFVSLALASVLDRRECAGNNCNRAISGTRPGISPASVRSADCKSFLLTVVTPSPTTTTVTVDEAGATPLKRDLILEARQVTQTASVLPTYASACSSPAAYASACSCFGVTGSVSTAPTPTVTVTTTLDFCVDL